MEEGGGRGGPSPRLKYRCFCRDQLTIHVHSDVKTQEDASTVPKLLERGRDDRENPVLKRPLGGEAGG